MGRNGAGLCIFGGWTVVHNKEELFWDQSKFHVLGGKLDLRVKVLFLVFASLQCRDMGLLRQKISNLGRNSCINYKEV